MWCLGYAVNPCRLLVWSKTPGLMTSPLQLKKDECIPALKPRPPRDPRSAPEVDFRFVVPVSNTAYGGMLAPNRNWVKKLPSRQFYLPTLVGKDSRRVGQLWPPKWMDTQV